MGVSGEAAIRIPNQRAATRNASLNLGAKARWLSSIDTTFSHLEASTSTSASSSLTQDFTLHSSIEQKRWGLQDYQ